MALSQTCALLQQWHGGDRAALEELLARDFAWVRAQVERRIGPALRASAEADDYVQDAMIEALSYTPRFVMSDKGQFRALLARITENVLRDHVERLGAKKRDDAGRARPASDTMLAMDPAAKSVTRPSQLAARDEERMWLQLGLEMLSGEDRRIVRAREFDGQSFVEIAEQMNSTEDAVRKRFHRALPKLARLMVQLRNGDVGGAITVGESSE